jgi:hypothetical protein
VSRTKHYDPHRLLGTVRTVTGANLLPVGEARRGSDRWRFPGPRHLALPACETRGILLTLLLT